MRKLMLCTIGFTVALLILATSYPPYLILPLVIVGCAGFYWRLQMKQWKKSLVFILLGGLFGWGHFTLYESLFHEPLAQFYEKTMEVQGEVIDFPTKGSYSYSVLVRLDLGKSSVKTLLYMDYQAENLQVGDRFTTEVLLKTAGETFQGDEITYYTAKGIMLRGVAEGDLTITPVEGIPLKHMPAYLAHWLKDGIEKIYEDEDEGVVLALVTGNRDGLSDSFSSALERTGLSHTVAVSGMHLAFLAGMLRLLLPSHRRWVSAVVIFVMILFMLVSGSTPSIMRATVMIVMLHLAPLFGRERDDATALSMALLVILLQNPYAINHVGLHLSVASVAGILLFAPGLQTRLCEFFQVDWHYTRFPPIKFVISALSATLSAMVITTPMVAYYFGTISLIAPISNILTLSAVSFAFAGGLVSGAAATVLPELGRLLSLPVLPVLDYIQWIVPKLSSNPLSAVTMGSDYYRIWLIFVYVLLFFTIFTKRKLYLPLALASVSFLLAFVLHRYTYFQSSMIMEVFDVGQGQCILFTLGERFIVSDCGGSVYENTGDMVADRVQSLGMNHVDLLVISHCHNDHANGVLQLFDRVSVGAIVMPDVDPENQLQVEIAQKAMENDTEIWVIEEETKVELNENQYIRLFPSVGWGEINDTGITLLVTSGEQDILVTGDMNMKTEEILIDRFTFPDIEMLIVGHHGSRYSTSSRLLEELMPEVAVISVSATNSYGHPTQEVLDRLSAFDIEIFRTDYTGTLRFRSAS